MGKKLCWEFLFENEHTVGDSRRLKVYGGWIFNTWAKHDGQVVSESCCFIPDPEHKWTIN